MIRIGLIGEDPYDKDSIKNLLNQRYKNIHFKPILRGVRGKQLDSPKTARAIKEELRNDSFKFLVFIRDLDGLPSQTNLKDSLKEWFKPLKHKKEDILLINIWELETLIFGDLDPFNKKYGVSLSCPGDPMMERDPKRTLMSKTLKAKRTYKESDCPDLFSKLDIDKVEKKCKFFHDFLTDFDHKLKA